MLPVGFEPTISAGERPQTHALDCAATGTGGLDGSMILKWVFRNWDGDVDWIGLVQKKGTGGGLL